MEADRENSDRTENKTMTLPYVCVQCVWSDKSIFNLYSHQRTEHKSIHRHHYDYYLDDSDHHRRLLVREG